MRFSVEKPVYPWRTNQSLEQVLADARPALVSLGAIEPTAAGCSDAEITAAERWMGRPVPEEVRHFYRAVRPTDVFEPGTRKEFGFYPLGAEELEWRPLDDLKPAEDWSKASGLFLGQSVFGDPFWWVSRHPTLPDGSIFLFDHEGAIGDVPFVYFARSFSELIGRIVHFKALMSTMDAPLFQQELRELASVWSDRRS